MVGVGAENAAPPRLTPQRDSTGAQPAAHGLAPNANRGSDTLERHSHRLQPRGFLGTRLSLCIGRLAAPLGRGWFGPVPVRLWACWRPAPPSLSRGAGSPAGY